MGATLVSPPSSSHRIICAPIVGKRSMIIGKAPARPAKYAAAAVLAPARAGATAAAATAAAPVAAAVPAGATAPPPPVRARRSESFSQRAV